MYGKGTPIYINNKKVRDTKELKQFKSDAIKNVVIITSPGARYDATANSVIRIRTDKRQGDGLSGLLSSKSWYNGYLGVTEQINLNYQGDKLNLFGSLCGYTRGHKENTSLSQDIDGEKSIHTVRYAPFVYRNTMSEAILGFNYDFNEDNSIGASYDVTCEPYAKGTTDGVQELTIDGDTENVIHQHI